RCFFFSSRRRHTRSKRDWSSDVCSSDLKRDLVHGMYDRKTKEPTVDYESPAIYGFLILYALEVDEEDLAQALYERMKEFQITDKNSDYYGGYSITDGNTHIFDNLVPLLAEQEMKDH